MAEDQPKPLEYIPETILKKRRHNEGWALKKRQQLEENKWRNKQNRKLEVKRAEHFIQDFRSKELDLIHMKHRKKRKRPELATLKSKLLFVVRIPQGKNDIHPKVKTSLHNLRLRRRFSGVFLKANDGVLDKLQRVEPFVTYGYPTLKNVRELVFKKGFAKIDGKKVPLTDNNMIEQELGKHGIICMEDIIHEIASVGPHFKEVCSFLWPFNLKKPEEGLNGKKAAFKEGGDSGNREDHINELISKMN